MPKPKQIATVDDTGSLGLFHLKRLWSASMAQRAGQRPDRENEWQMDSMLMDALGLGKHQTMQFLYQNAPGFPEFEDWVVATAGKPPGILVERINAEITKSQRPASVHQWLDELDSCPPVLTEEDMEFWEVNGYVVLTEAVTPGNLAAAEDAVWDYVNASPESPGSWYQGTDNGMMVELIQHPALQLNRQSPRIHKAFSQLWQTPELWVSADRCSFHPPQRDGHPFPGPDLHWDIDFHLPLTFATQGVLYLSDTPAEQGALTLVPGFHHRIKTWLENLPPGSDPNGQDINSLHALGSEPVPGKAGDMVIWHHFLPHGSRPNHGIKPRMVQYINMYPGVLQ